jgi:hypothetical protein
MTEILPGRRIVRIVAVAILSASAAWSSVVAADQERGARRKGDDATTAEQHAAHRAKLKVRHSTFKATLEKARADAEIAHRAFLDKQRAALAAENAKVMAEIARRRAESPEPQER